MIGADELNDLADDAIATYKSRYGIIGRIRIKIAVSVLYLAWLVFPATWEEFWDDLMDMAAENAMGALLPGGGSVIGSAADAVGVEVHDMTVDADDVPRDPPDYDEGVGIDDETDAPDVHRRTIDDDDREFDWDKEPAEPGEWVGPEERPKGEDGEDTDETNDP